MKKKTIRKRRVVKESAPVDKKDVDRLHNDLAKQARLIKGLEKNNKYLRDRISNLENRSNAVERILHQLQRSVDTLSRIFR